VVENIIGRADARLALGQTAETRYDDGAEADEKH
jgi:hypothetical protein